MPSSIMPHAITIMPEGAWEAYPEANLGLLFDAKVSMLNKIIAVKGDNNY